MSYFARNLWHRMWENIRVADDEDGVLDALDLDGDGVISVEEIRMGATRILGLSTDCTQMALARYVHRFADVNGQGEVTRDDLACASCATRGCSATTKMDCACVPRD